MNRALLVGAGALFAFAGATVATALTFARMLVRPEPPVFAVPILSVHPADPVRPVQPANPLHPAGPLHPVDSSAPGTPLEPKPWGTLTLPADVGGAAGTFGFTSADGTTHAILGEVMSQRLGPDGRPLTVVRPVLEVSRGALVAGQRGQLSAAVYESPEDVGLEAQTLMIPTARGGAPAWLIRGQGERAHVWVIMVHGRGATRTENIRALRTLHRLGLSALLISYQNDGEAPASLDAKYALGSREWEDVSAAMDYALEHGATELVLFGWSMGGAIALQAAARAAHKDRVRAVVLDAPVISWRDVLEHQSRLRHAPTFLVPVVQWLLSNPWASKLVGLKIPVELRTLDWLKRAGELKVPILVLHSVDDNTVPVKTTQALAKRNALVETKLYAGADHTREWNISAQRWDKEVSSWLGSQLFPGSNRSNIQGSAPTA